MLEMLNQIESGTPESFSSFVHYWIYGLRQTALVSSFCKMASIIHPQCDCGMD